MKKFFARIPGILTSWLVLYLLLPPEILPQSSRDYPADTKIYDDQIDKCEFDESLSAQMAELLAIIGAMVMTACWLTWNAGGKVHT